MGGGRAELWPNGLVVGAGAEFWPNGFVVGGGADFWPNGLFGCANPDNGGCRDPEAVLPATGKPPLCTWPNGD